MTFQEKVVVVTDGASGIGMATVEEFAAAGATVCIGDIAREKGEAVSSALRARGHSAQSIPLDLTSQSSVKEFAAEVLRRFGRVDGAILFFAGPQSDYVTGQVLSVSGGLTMVG